VILKDDHRVWCCSGRILRKPDSDCQYSIRLSRPPVPILLVCVCVCVCVNNLPKVVSLLRVKAERPGIEANILQTFHTGSLSKAAAIRTDFRLFRPRSIFGDLSNAGNNVLPVAVDKLFRQQLLVCTGLETHESCTVGLTSTRGRAVRGKRLSTVAKRLKQARGRERR